MKRDWMENGPLMQLKISWPLYMPRDSLERYGEGRQIILIAYNSFIVDEDRLQADTT